MNHQPYMRIVKDASCAVLFIHGILGSPDHFDFLLPLVPDSVSVQNILLDGHGKGVRDFSATSMEKWETQVSHAITELTETHQSIYIVAHSMGTLFALQEAVKQPQIRGLFLLAVPITPFPKMLALSNARKVYSGQFRQDDLHAQAADAAYSITADKNLLHYLPWVLRYLELFQKIHQIRKLLPQVKTPCVAYQSLQDEMVSSRSIPYLRKHSSIPVVKLCNSWHNLYDDKDRELIIHGFLEFLKNIK